MQSATSISPVVPSNVVFKTVIKSSEAFKRPKFSAKEALRQECVTMMRALRTNPLFLGQYDRLAYQSDNYPCPKEWKTLEDLTAHLRWLEMLTEFYSDYDRNKNTEFSKRWQLIKHVSHFKF